MRRIIASAITIAASLALAAPLAAQPAADQAANPDSASVWKDGPPITIQYMRPNDQRGINVFETTKDPGVAFDGFKMNFGAGFTSQLQNLSHSTAAVPNVVNNVNANELADIGFGFNNPTANFNVNVQLAPGIRIAMTSYLSSRHHNETWVKDGYIQIDQSPLDIAPLKMLMEIATIRVGDFEINYGDAHFRRSDNGNSIYNPFVGNYILDAFTTQIGGEVYLKPGSIIAMGAVTAGGLKGTVLGPSERGPVYIGKLGVDRQLNPDLRVRLTGSMYRAAKSPSDTLYAGDRAGSRYYFVLENTAATESAQYTSGLVNPGFKNEVRAYQVNPFVKYRGLEVFGVLEQADGKTNAEAETRRWRQYAVDAVYRFADENLFAGVRYNKAKGELTGLPGDVGANRWQVGGGWFITPNILAKGEYVRQEHFGYPVNNIKHGGKFNGFMMEGVVGF